LAIRFEQVITYRVHIACQCDVYEHNVSVNWCREFAVNFAIFKRKFAMSFAPFDRNFRITLVVRRESPEREKFEEKIV